MRVLKISSAIVGLTTSLATYAATPTDAAPFQVAVPYLQSGLQLMLEGLYLKPTNNNVDYATIGSISSSSSDTGTVSGSNRVIQPNYNFGFRVGLGYVFPSSGNDAQLNWTHFYKNSDDSATAGSNQFISALPTSDVFGNGNINGTQITASTSANMKFRLDNIDLDTGQYLDIGTRLQTRLFAGLRLTHLKNNITDNYSGIPLLVPTTFATESNTYNSKFNGIGPRFGVDTSYHVTHCFGVAAHAAVALLVGKIDSDSSFVNTAANADGATTTTSSTITDSSHQIVPNLDGKLGVNYSYLFRNTTAINAELGYQVSYYKDAVNWLQPSGGTEFDSAAFDGPYLSLNIKL